MDLHEKCGGAEGTHRINAVGRLLRCHILSRFCFLRFGKHRTHQPWVNRIRINQYRGVHAGSIRSQRLSIAVLVAKGGGPGEIRTLNFEGSRAHLSTSKVTNRHERCEQ